MANTHNNRRKKYNAQRAKEEPCLKGMTAQGKFPVSIFTTKC